MRVSIIQLEIKDNLSKNQRITKVEKILDDLGNVDLVVLPELWNVGYFSFQNYRKEAEKIDGETISRMKRKAKEIKAYLMAGSIIEKSDNKLYNTSALLDPEGNLIASYRKIHLWGYGSDEEKILTSGNEIVTAETNFGTVGISTCYDLRFPEVYRKQVESGAEIFLISAAWPYPRVEHWLTLNYARALENICFLISSNCSGKNQNNKFLGRSCIIDSYGNTEVTAGEDGCIVRRNIDIGKIKRARDQFPFLKDRKFRN